MPLFPPSLRSCSTCGASWSRPPSSWSGARAARRCVGVGRGDVLAEPLSTNVMKSAIHETSCGIQNLDPHALSDERSVLVICTRSPHYGGCAVLSNKDTFYPDIEVQSIYLDDTRRELPDKVMEGDPGWVLQGVISRASFRRLPLRSQKTLTVLSLHISNIYAKKRRIAKKLILTIRAIMILSTCRPGCR